MGLQLKNCKVKRPFYQPGALRKVIYVAYLLPYMQPHLYVETNVEKTWRYLKSGTVVSGLSQHDLHFPAPLINLVAPVWEYSGVITQKSQLLVNVGDSVKVTPHENNVNS